jgi:hypothetical protein
VRFIILVLLVCSLIEISLLGWIEGFLVLAAQFIVAGSIGVLMVRFEETLERFADAALRRIEAVLNWID